MKNPTRWLMILAALVPFCTAYAATHTINAVGVKFDPMFSYLEPGDSVSWENMTGHNVQTIDAMMPEGTSMKINSELGASVNETFTEPGIYVYKCAPHWGARMGGVIVVGNPENAEEIIANYMAAIEGNKAELLPAKGLLKKLSKDMESRG